MPPPLLRFAPSPNGLLHLGHAYSALLNAAVAKKLQGRFLLRLEDIDTTRCTPELAEHCLSDLAWLGLTWEEPVRVQSHHWNDYKHASETLKRYGLLYPCFCTRHEVAQASHAVDPDGAPLYPGTCARLTPQEADLRITRGEPHAWRLHMQKAMLMAPGPHHYYTRFTLPSMATETVVADPARWGDVILIRKETPTSYHLSVVVDDNIQQISHVVRGKDLEAATCLHTLLQTLLKLSSPLYHHHTLLTTPNGEKLSKSQGYEALAGLRERGLLPQDIDRMLSEIFPL